MFSRDGKGTFMRMILAAGIALLAGCSPDGGSADSAADPAKQPDIPKSVVVDTEISYLAREVDKLEVSQKATGARVESLESDIQILKSRVRELESR
jgi:hypothetical protein